MFATCEEELITVFDVYGNILTPCREDSARLNVELKRARWLNNTSIRLYFSPFDMKRIRKKVFKRDNHTCYWCKRTGDTIDHIIPWCKGGCTSMDNCICACSECNGLRGDTPADEWARLSGVPSPGIGERFNGYDVFPTMKKPSAISA